MTLIPQGPPSSSVANYRQISITSVLSKVFECLVSFRLRRFMECSGVLPTTKFAYRKGLGTCEAVLSVLYTAKCIREWAGWYRIVKIDCSAAFDMVDHRGILYRLCILGIGCSVLFKLTLFLSNRSQHVMVVGCRSKMDNVVSGVPQGSILRRYCSSCSPWSFFPFCKIS